MAELNFEVQAQCDWRFDEYSWTGITNTEIELFLPRCTNKVSTPDSKYCLEHELRLELE